MNKPMHNTVQISTRLSAGIVRHQGDRAGKTTQ